MDGGYPIYTNCCNMALVKSQDHLQRIPAAAILSVELLKQSKFPQNLRLALPLPEIVQNFSIFIRCLEWIRPTECEPSLLIIVTSPLCLNEQGITLCIRMKKIIKRILDQVLELPQQIQCREENNLPDPAPPELAISSILTPEEESAFLEWPNSVDWTRDVLQEAWNWVW